MQSEERWQHSGRQTTPRRRLLEASSAAPQAAEATAPVPEAQPPAAGVEEPIERQVARARDQLSAAAANVTVVRTGQELQQASLDGVRDIEIRQHMDLRYLSRAAAPITPDSLHKGRSKKQLSFAMMYAQDTTRSIRVRAPVATADMCPVPPSIPACLQRVQYVNSFYSLLSSVSAWAAELRDPITSS